MASKKNETEEKTVEPKTTPSYDWESELKNVEIADYIKDSFRYYINKNNINIKNKTELNRKLKDFDKRNAGE